MIKKGDIVGRKSYGLDILFKVDKIFAFQNKKMCILKGITERIEVDSEISDLQIIDRKEKVEIEKKIEDIINERIEKNRYVKEDRGIKQIYGKILHLDGDKNYSIKSDKYYRRLGLNAVVKNVIENKQPMVVYKLLKMYKPDVLVVTGHDGMLKNKLEVENIYNYRNSRHFIQTVKEARRFERENRMRLAIFAGACQSYFEGLILAGANFASSPARILIDFLDPLIVANEIAITPIEQTVSINDFYMKLRDGKRGINGIGCKGKKTTIIV